MMKTKAMLSLALLLFAWTVPGLTQQGPGVQVANGVELYKAGEYQRSLDALQKALLSSNLLSREEKIEAHKYSAFDQVALGFTVPAKESFRQALLLAPTLTLDPKFVSPKIIAIFEEVKSGMKPPPPPPSAKPPSRMGFALRSLIVPSWGQFAAHRKVPGFIFLGATVLALSNAGRTQTVYQNAQDNYLNAKTGSDFDGLFKKYDKAASDRNTGSYLLGTIWLANVVDAFFSKPPEPRHASRMERPSLGLCPTSSGCALVLRRDL
jgi:tetratricopeptide (TPR) repeat protein